LKGARLPRARACALALAALCMVAPGRAGAQRAAARTRYDPVFRKYSKRFFGPGFDWQYFKAQGIAESGLDPRARSFVGARGVMQLMPGTYDMIRKARHERMGSIEDPESNIAVAILHDRDLWQTMQDNPTFEERVRFMFGSYNAGEGPIGRARQLARTERLDDRQWQSVARVAPRVPNWRYRETLPYVQKIEGQHDSLAAVPRRANATRK